MDSDEEDPGAERAEIEREAREAMSQADSRRRSRPRKAEGAGSVDSGENADGLSQRERLDRFRRMREGVRNRGPEFLPDPFYDPSLDEEDERAAMKRYEVDPAQGMPHTDAMLHCPGCFSVVCIECQRYGRAAALRREGERGAAGLTPRRAWRGGAGTKSSRTSTAPRSP